MTDPSDRRRQATTANSRLDALVPPPWPTGRRVLTAGLVLLLTMAAVLTVHSGLLGPRLDITADGAGGSVDAADADQLEVERIVPVHNDGWLPLEIEGFEAPDLPDITWNGVDGLPATVEPGATHQIVLKLTVAGCDVDLRGHDTFTFRSRSGVTPARNVQLAAPQSSDPTIRTTYVADDGDELTLPVWPDQPPSWILDAIAPPCQTAPDGY